MRKHVKPAHPRAVIQDVERGRRLPPQGAQVAWNHYWAKLEARGDIVVEPEATPAVAPPAAQPEPAPVQPEAAPEPQAEPGPAAEPTPEPAPEPVPAPQPDPGRGEFQLRPRGRV